MTVTPNSTSAPPPCAFDQTLVKVGALHLPGGAGAVAELVAEVDHAMLAAAGEGRTGLALIASGGGGLHQATGLQMLHAARQQALADGEAREVAALQHAHGVAGARRPAAAAAPAGPAPMMMTFLSWWVVAAICRIPSHRPISLSLCVHDGIRVPASVWPSVTRSPQLRAKGTTGTRWPSAPAGRPAPVRPMPVSD